MGFTANKLYQAVKCRKFVAKERRAEVRLVPAWPDSGQEKQRVVLTTIANVVCSHNLPWHFDDQPRSKVPERCRPLRRNASDILIITGAIVSIGSDYCINRIIISNE